MKLMQQLAQEPALSFEVFGNFWICRNYRKDWLCVSSVGLASMKYIEKKVTLIIMI